MSRPAPTRALGLAAIVAALMAGPALASGELNLYSSRHYDTDERLYSDFEEQTGIKINRIEGNPDELLARIQAEGANSPADILLTVDAGRMWRADQAGILSPVESDVLARNIPAHLRHPDGHWFGFSQRARVIFYDREDVTDPPLTYQELADPKYKGKVCTRSSSNIYSLSIMAALIDHLGAEAAKEWAAGVYENRARDPQGGDTDQLRAIVSGECDIVLSNTYYFARGLGENVDGLSSGIDRISWVFPNQSDIGTHVNISAGAVTANAPNRENAIRFLEYLSSDSAQRYFAEGNYEYPAVAGIGLSPELARLGLFRADDINLEALGRNQTEAQALYDAVGYK